MSTELLAVLVAALGSGLGGVLVPRLIARVPEPETTSDEETEPKEPYRAIAALPGLALRSAVAAAVAGVLVGVGVGWSWLLLPWVLAVPVGVALAVIDWRTRLLPFRITTPLSVVLVPSVLLICLLTGGSGDVVRALAGAIGSYVFYLLLWVVNPRGMGYGDVRLAFPLGLLLGAVGVAELLFGVWMAFVIGAVVGVARGGVRGARKRLIPFGPFMLLGSLAGLLWGGAVLGGLAA